MLLGFHCAEKREPDNNNKAEASGRMEDEMKLIKDKKIYTGKEVIYRGISVLTRKLQKWEIWKTLRKRPVTRRL